MSLAPSFRPLSNYVPQPAGRYSLLPLRFLRLDDSRCLVTNLVGEHLVLSFADVQALIRHTLSASSPIYDELKSRHFLIESGSSVSVDLLATKLRTHHRHLADLTGLFLFVTTLRCEHSCRYCQVSRQSDDKQAFDMSHETAERAVEFMFNTPSPTLKVEFQGGEPLLNFPLLQHIVSLVEARNATTNKDIAFVVATNLALLSEEHLAFFRDHRIGVSTSLDGPAELHNRNRPRRGSDSYQRAVDGIRRVRDALGRDSVSALMTTTEASLDAPEAIVDEYVRQGFNSIFLRSLSPYGFAVRTGEVSRYGTTRWLHFYERALRHIVALNRGGTPFREEFATIVLGKMLTPWPSGYVDLRSPAGIGIGALVFNYDGTIYPSDEARMLAEMGDTTFSLGRLGETSWRDAMTSDTLLEPILASMTETAPMCSDCAAQPYCGADPVGHHATQGDFVGFKPASAFCQKQLGVVSLLVRMLEDEPETAEVLRSWVR